jgi:hypothetical protein
VGLGEVADRLDATVSEADAIAAAHERQALARTEESPPDGRTLVVLFGRTDLR